MAMSSPATRHAPDPRRSTTPPVAATANDGDLPLDLLYEILLRLPTKSLCRFRAVCKSWRSVLCHQEFIGAAHTPGPLLAIGIKDGSSSNEVHVLDIESGDAVKHVKIAANDAFMSRAMSDDGLICIIDEYCRLGLRDLASGEFFLMPDRALPLGYSSMPAIVVGRVDCTGEHKVLAIFAYGTWPQVCKIFTLGNDGWRYTGSPPLKVKCHTRYLAIVNGVIYLLSDYSEYEKLHAHKIMVFDLSSEAWRPVATTLLGPTKRFLLSLAELDGNLVAGHSDKSTEIELWFLVDIDRSHWSKRYIITIPYRNLSPPMCYAYFVKPLAMLNDGRIVLWTRFSGLEISTKIEVLWIYDPRTKTFMEATRLTCCSRVSVFTWNGFKTKRSDRDMAAKHQL